MSAIAEAAPLTPGAQPAEAFAELWRRRLVRALLYGSKIDRGAKARARVGLAILAFAVVYSIIAARLVMFAVVSDGRTVHRVVAGDAIATAPPDILDRRGEVLATDVRVPSLYGEPRRLIDVDEAVELLTADLPDLDATELRERLSSKRGFVWLKRDITSEQQRAIYKQGLPGIGFLNENKRDYPSGAEVSHVIGHVNIDNQGIAGMEKWLDGHGLAALHMAGLATDRLQTPVQLAVDLRVQHALRDELVAARTKFKALAAAGIVLDVRTGEIVAMVSEPDYDPNNPREALDPTRINRLTTGVFEMGSTFKAFTIAMALDSGKVTLKSSFDARMPLRFGKFDIHDFHAQNRVLTVPEIFTYSSNIGAARAALAVGIEAHTAFLKKLGQLDRLRTELPESAEPIVPKRWGELNTMTIAFGQGLNVAPIQAVMAVCALVNGGEMMTPTFLPRTEEEAAKVSHRVISEQTSESMRYLMRSNATHGSASFANIPGYYVGGKTGTADKIIHGHYAQNRVFNTFMAITPSDKPKYLYLTIYDDPQPTPEDHGFHTAAYNAGRVAGALIRRVEPLEGVPPEKNPPNQPFPIIARLGYGADADKIGKE